MAGVGERNAPWKTAIDQRVASGGGLGLPYLQGLASQYGVPYSQITNFVNNAGYTLGARAAAAAAPTVSASSAGQTTGPRLKIEDINRLEAYLQGQAGGAAALGSGAIPFRGSPDEFPGYRTLADYMGIRNINSESEIKRALQILGGASSPLAAAQAATAGVVNYNSLNDYLRGLGGGKGAPTTAAPAAAPTPATPQAPQAPTRSMTAAEAMLAGIDEMLAQMNDEAAMAKLASEQQAKIQQEASRTLAANMARSQMMPNLQIQPATGITRTAGTQGFRRRNDQFNLQPRGALGTLYSGISSAAPQIINI